MADTVVSNFEQYEHDAPLIEAFRKGILPSSQPILLPGYPADYWAKEEEGYELLFSPHQIRDKVAQLALEIQYDFKNNIEEVLLVGLMHGALYFTTDLTRALDVSFTTLAFGKQGGVCSEESLIEGKHVLVVEDIVRSGKTLINAVHYLKKRKPRSVCGVAMVRCMNLTGEPASLLRYHGFDIEEKQHLIGYGMDDNGKYRQLPYIARLEEGLGVATA